LLVILYGDLWSYAMKKAKQIRRPGKTQQHSTFFDRPT
jgi:hypothetical protein